MFKPHSVVLCCLLSLCVPAFVFVVKVRFVTSSANLNKCTVKVWRIHGTGECPQYTLFIYTCNAPFRCVYNRRCSMSGAKRLFIVRDGEAGRSS